MRPPASAASTSRPRRPGAARPTAPSTSGAWPTSGWVHGSLVEPAIEEEPAGDPNDIAELLDSAEEIVNEVAPDAVEEARADDARKDRQNNRWWRRRR